MKLRVTKNGRVVHVRKRAERPLVRVNLLDKPLIGRKQSAIARLRALRKLRPGPAVRRRLVETLVEYIGDAEIEAAYQGLPKWEE